MEILLEGSLDYCEVKEWKKRYFVMKYEISSALRYIEIYKDKNWRKQLPRHVVNLHPGYEVKRIKTDPKRKYIFLVKTTDHCLTLAADDETVMNQWLATFEEYNLVKSFCVQPQDTPTMAKIEAIYPCHLQMVHSEVRLVSAMDGKFLGLWPFKCIRRYKFTGNVFSIEAGRKAPTGEGMFEFISNECSEIYRVMDTIIRTKAGDSTIRRLASQKVPPRIGEHQQVRKTVSHPHSSPSSELHYDYATPDGGKIPELSRSPPVPPVDYPPSPPSQLTPLPSNLDEDHYDSLSPVESPSHDSTFESKGPMNEPSSYDSLQFKQPKADKTENDMIRSPSAGSYDTLAFTKQSTSSGELGTVQESGYDTLQFDRPARHNSSSSIDDGLCVTSKPESTLKSRDVYNTLNRLDSIATESPVVNTDNTYDSLNSGQVTNNTYNSLGEISSSPRSQSSPLEDTYNHMSNIPRHPSPIPSSSIPDPEKPTAPARPPPRHKAVKPAKEEPQPRKVAPPVRPARQQKPPRKQTSVDSVDGTDGPTQNPAKESMKDAIQRKMANAPDDGSYASVDHDYASVDYSKVSTKPEPTTRSAVYSEPIETGTTSVYAEPSDVQTAPTNIPKPSKPKRNPPRAIKNIFKKTPPPPPTVKPKPGSCDDAGDFANELKKKLEVKLKKTESATAKGSVRPRMSKQTSSDNPDDGIYAEVDDEMNI